MKELETENARLKKLLAEKVLKNELIKDALRKKWCAHARDSVQRIAHTWAFTSETDECLGSKRPLPRPKPER